jgi:hypothetical protein
MTDDERDRALYAGFEFGLRVMMDAHDMQLPGAAGEKPWNLLQEIADGSTTIVQSKGDWVAGHRKIHPEMERMLDEYSGRLIASDRETAAAILRAFYRLLRP